MPFSKNCISYTFTKSHLKGLSHEMDLAFDDMHDQIWA
jgi:hypothetical protein